MPQRHCAPVILVSSLLAAFACRATPTATTERPELSVVAETSACAEPCSEGQTCVEFFELGGAPHPAVAACEQRCSPTADDCPQGQFCSMQSEGPGFVCRTRPPAPSLDRDTQNLVALAELWSYVRFVHPRLLGREHEWNAALLAAVPGALTAQTDADLHAVMNAMLATIGDPATFVHANKQAAAASGSGEAQRGAMRTESETLIVELAKLDLYGGDITAVAAALETATQVIFDLRGIDPKLAEWLDHAFADWGPLLSDEVLELPAARTRVSRGFPSQVWATSGGYYAALETPVAERVRPRVEGRAPRVAFVVDEAQLLPAIAIPLAERGAPIFSESPLDARVLAKAMLEPLPGGGIAQIRIADPVYRGGRPKLDGRLINGLDPIALARASFERPARRQRVVIEALESDEPSLHAASPVITELPSQTERILAAIDMWSVLDAFHAYPRLRPRWDHALAVVLQEVRAADSIEAYVHALQRLVARIEDGHARLLGPTLSAMRGSALPALEVLVVEGCVVITRVDDPTLSPAARVGDVIVEVDGVPIAEGLAEQLPLVSASTPNSHRLVSAYRLLRGPEDRALELVVERSGELLEVKVARIEGQLPEPDAATHPRWRELEGRVGYVDLRLLEPSEVPEMFAALADTNAIIFDMRGYPKQTAWTIVPQLDQHRHPYRGRTDAAAISQPMVFSGYVGIYSTTFIQRLPESDVEPYPGRTLMLTDERTVSQAEHTGLFFEAANGTVFVGSASAGTNGDVTSHVLPHGLYLRFTGQAIAHADGRPLQRVGLPLALEVAPTIAGIRAGQDEVLAAAQAFLRTAKSSGTSTSP